MTATRNGLPPRIRDAARTLPPGVAAEAAAKATRRLIAALQATEDRDARTFAALAEARYWADAVQALTSYVAMFERNP